MFEADFSRTERIALVDDAGDGRATFARRVLAWAKDHGHNEIAWHFANLDAVGHLDGDPTLGRMAKRLRTNRQVTIGRVRVSLATDRLDPPNAPAMLPLAVWWATDDRLLSVDTTHRPLLAAFVSAPSRAPVWLTAFGVEVAGKVGVRVTGSGLAGSEIEVEPLIISERLQSMISSHSRPMTLSTNGVHDSLAGPLIRAARDEIASGTASPEAVAVAALRAGWWPEKVPALIDKPPERAFRLARSTPPGS